MARGFICFLNDDDCKREGYVDILEINPSYVKFTWNRNVLTIPFSRIIKIKEDLE